jgi:hypothetical protein
MKNARWLLMGGNRSIGKLTVKLVLLNIVYVDSGKKDGQTGIDNL